MKKLIYSLVGLFAFVTSFAQVPTEKSLLWKIEGKGLAKPSYLYGTIHIMCPDDIDVKPQIRSAFNSTEQLYLEIDMSDISGAMGMLFGMTMNDGSSLKTLLSQEDYDSVAAVFKRTTGMALGAMSRIKPIMLMQMVYPSILGCKPEGWEGEFTKMAKDREMQMFGLEKIEDQIAVLDSIPYKEQAEMFKKSLLNLDSSKLQFQKMVEVYKQQDIQQMITMTASDEATGAYEDIMLRKRNQNWIPVIASAAKKKPSFFAVGAAHLGGEYGVINLLRQKGYKVTAVKY
jgi:uncharacterized protein YbaP (TraB family)